MKKLILFTLIIAGLGGCSYVVPKEAHKNACALYDFDDDWQEAAEESAKKWGTPPHILLAFVKQESGFQEDAKPPKEYFLGLIPYQRSSAYGYSQAKDEVWSEYLTATGRTFASREDIHDALDFMGWYNYNSHKRNKISRYDAYALYLAYHEGNGGYEKKTYLKKPWLIKVAKKVKLQADAYHKQLKNCGDYLQAEAKIDQQQNKADNKAAESGLYHDINTGKMVPCNAPWPYCR